MNLAIPLFAIWVIALAYLAQRRSPWLFFLLPIAYSLPTARTFVGPVPIYWYDCAAASALYLLYRTGFWLNGGTRVFPWVPVFGAVFLVFGVLMPLARYGIVAELAWTFSHLLLAWCLFYVGLAISLPRYLEHAKMLAKGMVVSLGWLAVVSALSWRNPERTVFFNEIFYKDFYAQSGGMGTLTDFAMTSLWAYRAQGPFMNPSNLAIFSVFFVAFILIARKRVSHRWLLLALVFASLNIVASVSRQVIVAACLAGLIYTMLAPVQKSIRGLIIATSLIIGVLASTGGGDILSERFDRVAEQGFKEENVAARLLDGPQRLFTLFQEKPGLLFTGVGLDADKLVTRGVNVNQNEAGFVSNSFLLSLYYTGIVGFIAYVSLWIWALLTAWRAPQKLRPLLVSIVAMGIFLTFVDNTIFKFEAITGWALFTLGTIAGICRRPPSQAAPPPRTPTPQVD